MIHKMAGLGMFGENTGRAVTLLILITEAILLVHSGAHFEARWIVPAMVHAGHRIFSSCVSIVIF